MFQPEVVAKTSAKSRARQIGYERERFEELATRSMLWIERELELARPRLVVTLGTEILLDALGGAARHGSDLVFGCLRQNMEDRRGMRTLPAPRLLREHLLS